MSKKKQRKNTNIKVKEKEVKDLFWEDLIQPSIELRDNLASINLNLKALYEKYEEHFKNPEIQKIYSGIGKALEELVKNFKTLESLHTKEVNGVLKYYAGKVDPEDQKQVDLYINISLGYGGIANQVLVLTNTSIIALTNKLQELTGEVIEEDTNVNTENSEAKENKNGGN